jgi:hypothetical protein
MFWHPTATKIEYVQGWSRESVRVLALMLTQQPLQTRLECWTYAPMFPMHLIGVGRYIATNDLVMSDKHPVSHTTHTSGDKFVILHADFTLSYGRMPR